MLVDTGKVKCGSHLGQSRGALERGEKPGRMARRARSTGGVRLRLLGLEDSVRELETQASIESLQPECDLT